MTQMEDLLWQSARETAQLIRDGNVSAVEVMNAHYNQIEALNPMLNAIVNLLPRERALALAAHADKAISAGTRVGSLHGIPMAPKDMIDVQGFPTTQGFVPFADRVAASDCELVARQRQAGALMIGKTNLPEFALGSHTFNELFGITRNPYDHSRTAGGSSGGAAAALASGMLSIADGSDMGGSLRNPAAFCNVVGLRPSIGRVPDERGFGWLGRLATAGPMARSVRDMAWLFSVQAGPFPGDPLTLPEPGSVFRDIPEIDLSGKRVAMTEDLNLVPVDSEVRHAVQAAARTLETLGAQVEVACPDLSEAMAVFQTLRAANLAVTGRTLDRSVPDWRSHAKDTAIWNIEKGFALTAEEIIDAELNHTRIFREVSSFFDNFDLLVLPSAQIPPFPVEMHWVDEIEGQTLDTYIDWMTVCCAISVTGLPALSIPGGFTADGLPIGVQFVAGPRQDLALLAMAQCFEQATGFGARRPGATTATAT
jgi:amidase